LLPHRGCRRLRRLRGCRRTTANLLVLLHPLSKATLPEAKLAPPEPKATPPTWSDE
jgi:hypothetical protein